MKLSDQAMGVLAMALLKCLAEQTDIRELLSDMDFQLNGTELVIPNPPIVHLSKELLQSFGDDDNA